MTSSFPWQALKVVCDGVSIIDIPKLEIQSEAEAHQFLLSYGYDLYEPSHQEQVWKLYDEAARFLEGTLSVTLPDCLKRREEVADIRNLLLVASGQSGFPQSKHQSLVCALLRIMHALSHLKNDLRLKYLVKIRKQTIGRFEAHLQRKDESGNESLYLGFERDKIPLLHFEKKEGKNRSSVLLKLLQKRESVAQEIYDHIGVRMVTKSKADAIWAVKYLIDHHLISVANIMSARCRNTLVSLEAFKRMIAGKSLESIEPGLFDGEDSELAARDGLAGAENPFRSSDFHSLQFTCRPLIRIPVVRKGGIRAEITFFFPIEIQILDEASFLRSQKGDASHVAYKQKQIEAVRERVLKGHI